MTDDLIPARDLAFVLYEVLEAHTLARYPYFAEHDRTTFDAALETARAIAVEQFAPHNRASDLHEPTIGDDGRVRLVPGIKQALDAYCEAGFMTAHLDFAAGGMQLPHTVTTACTSLFQGANIATAAYPMLSHGAANLLHAYASEAQKQRYMNPIHDGRYFGTMCLSEPHAGSSLADITTRAEPLGDGRYRLYGAKMWISGGEHELSENIVHLVLAKLPDAPPGVKGISLFIVPRYRINPDGSNGPANDVRLAGLNHKMGYRGTTNTFLKLGENGDCIGELLGEANRGLTYMFHMMNEARIAVGMGAIMLGYAGYRHSLGYARERPQGRQPDRRDPLAPPVPIVEHADVRHMLLRQKCYAEGAFHLGLHAARLVDMSRHHPDTATRTRAARQLDVLTPVVKSWPSTYCLQANELAIQVLGGAGYTRDYPVEQYYRDNRLNAIHEGTNGIQALDLLGRKAMMDGGETLNSLLTEAEATARDAAASHELAPMAESLADAAATVRACTGAVEVPMGDGRPRLALANASAYLDLLGHTLVGWMWLQQARTALAALPTASDADTAFYRGKLQACRYFFAWELPRVRHWGERIQSLDDSALAMAPDWF